jgi:cytosine/adenosine deaminase-related metal-dependent hydrolase
MLPAAEPVASSKHKVALDGYFLLPGLINAHDHLQFALFPRMGMGPYENAGEWASDIHRNETERINVHRAIPRDARIWWGGLRNLLCGVTTVCHHDSLSPRMREDDFPVSVVERMAWAHSLMFEQDVGARAEDADLTAPFVLHAAEGTDAKSATEVERLDRLGVLSDRTVVIHGLALDKASVDRLNARQASLVCCPSSNDFLFHQIPSKDMLRAVNSLALGSDSPLTSTGDLLDELRYAREHIGLSAPELYRMVLMSPAKMLRLRNGEGRLMPGGVANLIATRDTGQQPGEILAGMSWREVELVIREGRVFLASDMVYQRLPHSETTELVRLCVEDKTRWIRAPLAWLFAEASSVARDGALSLGGKMARHG